MKNDSVLHFLRANRTHFLSGEEISRRLKVSRSAVWKEIQTLRHLGYEIEAQPHWGYRLAQIPDKLFADELSVELDTGIVGRAILSYEQLDSSNDAVFKLGEQGQAEGACIFAEFQKKGRGRLGRVWEAPKGKNILFSCLLRPKIAPSQAAKITLMVALSVVKTIRSHTGKSVGIKWPNDIVYDEKKCCGILTEMSAELDRVNFIVVGVGLNVNAENEELPKGAASMKSLTGKSYNRVEIARDLLRRIDADYARFRSGHAKELADEWEEYSATSGRRVTATLLDRTLHGQALGIDADGALWIRTDSGLQERIVTGDVTHVRAHR